MLLDICCGIVTGLNHAAVGQIFHVGIFDQLLGANCCTQAAVVALGVINNSQILLNGDGILGADLLAQAAADTADGTAAGGDSALCQRSTGDDHIPVGLHGYDQVAGTDSCTGQTANTTILIDFGNTVDNGNGVVLTGLYTGAEAQAAKLAGQGAVAADLGSCHTVMKALILSFDLSACYQITGFVVTLFAGAANQSYLAGDFFSLDTHNGCHSLGAFVAAGGTLANGCFAVQNGFCIAAAASIAAAAAVCAGQAFI